MTLYNIRRNLRFLGNIDKNIWARDLQGIPKSVRDNCGKTVIFKSSAKEAKHIV